MGGKHLALKPVKKKENNRLWLVLATVGLTVVCAAILFFIASTDKGRPPIVRESIAPENENPSIAIPGYEGITLEAGTKKQSVALNNPETNTCYFLISLYLEDGTLLWQSEYLAPGQVSENIVLSQKLEPGYYKAVLHYDCFRMNKELSPLNGAETKLTLRVK